MTAGANQELWHGWARKLSSSQRVRVAFHAHLHVDIYMYGRRLSFSQRVRIAFHAHVHADVYMYGRRLSSSLRAKLAASWAA